MYASNPFHRRVQIQKCLARFFCNLPYCSLFIAVSTNYLQFVDLLFYFILWNIFIELNTIEHGFVEDDPYSLGINRL